MTKSTQALQHDVQAAQSGDSAAFERLIQHSQQLVTSTALSIVKRTDHADDIAQQVYLAVWQQLHQLRSPSSFLPWLRQITRNNAYKWLRQPQRREEQIIRPGDSLRPRDNLEQDYNDTVIANVACNTPSAEEQYEQQQQQRMVRELIDQLPADSRELVLLYYREQQSTSQVAQLLDISEATVRKRLSRVRQTLKTHLLQQGGKALLATAPTLAFSAVMMSTITASPPIAAATMISTKASIASGSAVTGSAVTGSVSTGVNSWYAKLAILCSGALMGAAVAMLAVIWGSKQILKQLSNDELRRQHRRQRNGLLLFLAIFGVLFALSYECTQGAWGPLLSYSLLVVVLGRYQYNVTRLLKTSLTDQGRTLSTTQRWLGYSGLVFGVLSGLAGLIVGLVQAGRL